ncbi:HEAT repeat domain-containing protein [Collimonas humicola]|uniref:hypothetical protein n=1 Tax=Collimonas humicola TaxID=2825886 RepID=UPI001B8B2477|nr:hypothetical protein [Collimonas humicola]
MTTILLLSLTLGIAFAQNDNKVKGQQDSMTTVIKIEGLIAKTTSELPDSDRAAFARQLPDLIKQADKSDISNELIDKIATLLSDREDVIRLYAAVTLGNIGPNAVRAVPALERALKEAQNFSNSPKDAFGTGLYSSDAIVPALERIQNLKPGTLHYLLDLMVTPVKSN